MKKFFVLGLFLFTTASAFAQSYKCDFLRYASEETTKGPNDIVLRNAVISVGETKEFEVSSTRKVVVDLYKRSNYLDIRVLFMYNPRSPYASGQINASIPMTQKTFFIGTSYDMPAPDYYHAQNLSVGCTKL